MENAGLIVETKGYGFIASSVMKNEKVSWGAKALYAYLISISGNHPSCWPSNSTIMKNLAMKSKITLNKFKDELVREKLLKIEERKYKSGQLASNSYFPAKVKLAEKDTAPE